MSKIELTVKQIRFDLCVFLNKEIKRITCVQKLFDDSDSDFSFPDRPNSTDIYSTLALKFPKKSPRGLWMIPLKNVNNCSMLKFVFGQYVAVFL